MFPRQTKLVNNCLTSFVQNFCLITGRILLISSRKLFVPALKMAASQNYKDTLANWLLREIEACGSGEKLAARIGGLSGQYLRNLSQKKYVKELDREIVALFAAYRGETTQQTEAWLNSADGAAAKLGARISRDSIFAIDDLYELAQIQSWLTDRQRQLVARQERATYFLSNTQADVRRHIQHNLQEVAATTELSRDRLTQIVAGDPPLFHEIGLLAKYFSPIGDTEELLRIFPEVKAKPTPGKRTAKRSHAKIPQ
jgi:hypothetical protein